MNVLMMIMLMWFHAIYTLNHSFWHKKKTLMLPLIGYTLPVSYNANRQRYILDSTQEESGSVRAAHAFDTAVRNSSLN